MSSLSLPNLLTLSRIAAVPLVCVPLAIDTVPSSILAFTAFAYACVTDYLDGFMARRLNQLSEFGRMLDPIADKLLVGGVLIVLAGIGRLPEWHLLPAVVIVARELAVSGLREHLAPKGVVIPVTRLAKWKTMTQMLALGLLLLGPAAPAIADTDLHSVGLALLWLAAVITTVTGWSYLRAAARHASTR